MMKRMASLALTLVMLLSAMPMTGFAAELENLHGQPALMTADGSCGQNLTWFLDSDGTMTISGSGPMLDYDSKPSPWFDYASEITKLVLDAGITYIGNYAFCDCVNLSGSLVIPEGVTEIGECAFYGCCGLTGELVIPDGVERIGSGAFSNCTGLTGLKLPSTLTEIGSSAFFRCSGMTGDLRLPDSVVSLDSAAFYECGFDGRLLLSNGLTAIPYSAFAESRFTGDLVLPENLTAIESCAFEYSSGFDGELVIPDGVEALPDCAFRGTSGITSISFGTGLREIYVSEDRDNAHWDALHGMTSVTEMTFHGLTPPVPTVEGISPFDSMTGLETVYVPAEAMEAYQTAFHTYISDNVTISPIPMDDGPAAEGSCGGAGLTLGDGLKTLGNFAFSGSGFAGALVIPDGVTNLAPGVFRNMNGITSITFGKGVNRIATEGGTEGIWGNALRGMSNVTELTFRGAVPTLSSNTQNPFVSMTKLKTVHVPADHYWAYKNFLYGKVYSSVAVKTDFSQVPLQSVGTGMVYSRTAVLTWEAHPGSVDRTAPDTPTGVTASDGSGSVEIRWEQGGEQDLGTYTVLRSDTETGSFTVIASGLKTLNYFDRTALPGVTYFYKVRVCDRAGNESLLSAPVSAAAAPDTREPSIVSVYPGGGSLGEGFETVSVLASDDYGLDTVTLEYSLDGVTFIRLHSLSGIGQPTAAVTAQLPLDRIAHGSTVLLRASVTDLSGNIGQSREISYTADKLAPGVTSVRAEYADGSVRILWSGEKEADLAGYRVYRKTGVGGSYQLIAQRQAADQTDYAWID